ncbi:hypothetical protein COL75_13380, partial [Bacillus wiedmannii]|uniref:hypothetical protein n=1 Tax=Bacillus wiedmannii TaxID=1890302 RepID=UPI000C00DAFE
HGYSHAVAKTRGFAKENVDITVALHAKYGAIGLGLNLSFTGYIWSSELTPYGVRRICRVP